jgi:alpha-ketoglutarate-dependent taurine dioxygenase
MTDLLIQTIALPDCGLPVVMAAGASADAASWIAGHRDWIEDSLCSCGAILFRGFAIRTEFEFHDLVAAFNLSLMSENGEHVPTNVVPNVFTPVQYAATRKLLWHNENSFNYEWPSKIVFGCLKPAGKGGETPLADGRAVLRAINADMREEFDRKQVMYIRNYGEDLGLSWQHVFGTTDPAVVERICLRSRTQYSWRQGNRLTTRCIRPVAITHPTTGDIAWFAQPQHWHLACLDKDTREALVALFEPNDLPRNCMFGDGSPIPDEYMAHLMACYQEVEISFQWQAGDVLFVDNILAAHARNPYEGTRRLVVSMGDIRSFGDGTEPVRLTKDGT